MNKWVLSFSLALVFSGSIAQAADVEAGKVKSAACAACHSADGNSVNPVWPSLAGQNASYISKQLADFKSGARKNAIMMGMSAALTQEDMNDLGAYYASQTIKGGEAAADKVTMGEMLYRAGNAEKGLIACTACHGPMGGGIATSGFPAVSGQHAVYVEQQLNDFASGTRANDPNRMMRDIAEKLSADEIAAVAQYMQGLK